MGDSVVVQGLGQLLSHVFNQKTTKMKFKLIVFLQLLFIGSLMAQGGIKFSEGSWEEILAKAKAENRVIFMDAYTTWCGPCKMMTQNTFPERAVGDFYNATFVNVKVDMEKGEGLEIARNYEVRAYPTLLFINGDGELVHRGVGYRGPDELIALGKIASDPDENSLGMERRYKSGDYEADFLRKYALAKAEMMDGDPSEIAEAYLATQSDWGTEKNREFIYTLIDDAEGKMFDYLVENRQAFSDQFGKVKVINRIQALILRKAFTNRNEMPALEEIDALFTKAYPEAAPQLSANFRMVYFQQTGDLAQYAKTAIDYFDKYPSDDMMELNNASWAFYESVTDMKQLKKAVKWAEKSVKLNKQYFNMDTLAALYFKTGKTKKGLKTANEAIDLAKANDEDYTGTVQLIELYTK
ncbi:MAG: hypothetical protein DHS20C18_21150 [Saprospiraceae bacterium]|nr:MAG: hypothetical protein DHS20C18_21150 [Saprospiraceae bacterium]